MAHPNETWSQQVIEDVQTAVANEARYHECRPAAAARTLFENFDSNTWASGDIPREDYLAAVLYELCGFAGQA